jgi:hypothetical protein
MDGNVLKWYGHMEMMENREWLKECIGKSGR